MSIPTSPTPIINRRLSHFKNNPAHFFEFAGNLQLRPYQTPPLEAIIDSIRNRRGLTFVVIFPRQSGKNETQAALFTYLLRLFSRKGGDIISLSPTYKPQTENAMHRLRTRLDANQLILAPYHKSGYIFRVGLARAVFFSGEPGANVVGAPASLLLSVDEAQNVSIAKYDKDFEPMVASTNATRVFWGTRWTSDTLLERELTAATIAEKADRDREASSRDPTPAPLSLPRRRSWSKTWFRWSERFSNTGADFSRRGRGGREGATRRIHGGGCPGHRPSGRDWIGCTRGFDWPQLHCE